MIRSIAAAAALALLLPGLAAAQEIPRREGVHVDTWSEPHPGVRYLRRTAQDPPLSLHALVVDLAREGVSVAATAEGERWDSISGYAQRRGAIAAINGGFWNLLQRPEGITAGDGELWSASAPSPDFGHLALTDDGRARVRAPGEGEDPRTLSHVRGAISGRPMLLEGGEVRTEELDAFPTANLKQPRTAVGVSRDGRTLVLVVADGRQAHSRGLTLYQLARTLRELGAHRAINLDGGGSSAMYVERAGGLVSSPARGRWARAIGLDDRDETARVRTRAGAREVYVRGIEREVMNHLVVFAPAPEVDVAAADDTLLDGLGHLAAEDRRRPPAALVRPPQPVRLGAVREWLYPALGLVAPAAALWLALAALRRLRRRLAARA